MSIFKSCDVRGVVGSELNEEIARKIGLALGTMIVRSGGDPVYLAGDFRRSTPALKQALQAGLLDSGIGVKDVGQAPTPVAYFAAARQECGNVAIVTASHNAGRYNGVKFMVAGQPAIPKLVDQLQMLLEVPVSSQHIKQVEPVDVLGDYEASIRTQAAELSGGDPFALARRHLTIVLDAMGGAFSDIAPRVLRDAGCQVIPLRCAIDPDFSQHEPNPAVDANLVDLSRCVVAERADFGVALDGDGDRATVMDSSGQIVRPEQIGALLIQRCFSQPSVVFDLKCSSVLAETARAAGGTCLMQPSGYRFMKTAMIRCHADLGVEVSGHYFFRTLNGGDDGLFIALLMAHLVAGSGLSLAELIEPIGWSAITPDLRLPLPSDAAGILEQIASHCGGEVSRLDGVRAQYHDGWALARLSITEPLITLRFEASQRVALPIVAARFLHNVPDLCKQVLEALR
jgi:phosphomannomutase / phosphoglucomutase